MPESPAEVPEGFALLEAGGGYFRQLGPVYIRREGAGAVVGLRIAEQHLNMGGVAHGGMLTTVADSALGINISLARGKRGGQVTVTLSADFLASARRGEWMEAHVEVTRLGRTLAYANCELRAGERRILRASGVFAFVDRPLPPGTPTLADLPLDDG